MSWLRLTLRYFWYSVSSGNDHFIISGSGARVPLPWTLSKMFEIILILALLVLAIILFSTDHLSFDVVGLLLLSVLLGIKILTPEEAFRGFGSDTIVTIGGLFVLSAGLLRTGLIDRVGKLLQKHAGDNPHYLAILIMITVAVASAFISNTAATAFFFLLLLLLHAAQKYPLQNC